MSGCAEPAGTVGAFLCRAGQRLRAASIESPRLEARLLLGHAMRLPAEELIRDPERLVPSDAAIRFGDLLRRRLDHAPIAHLLGERGFWSLSFAVSPSTLIPRPDSETLIEAALEAFPERSAVRRILDLGTGTGCLLLAALAEFGAASGVGVDRVPAAAALARSNAERLGMGKRAAFLTGDWAAALEDRFDLVLCNPPYIESGDLPALMPEVARYEPATALDGGPDGLGAYRAVLMDLARLLTPDGRAVLELGVGQGPEVESLAVQEGLEVVGCRADLGGADRALVLARKHPVQQDNRKKRLVTPASGVRVGVRSG